MPAEKSIRSQVYYPLSANAFGLTAGAQYAAFKRRLKVAALLHDKIILEAGLWLATSGPAGNYRVHFPPGTAPEFEFRLQTAWDRKRAVGGQFAMYVSDTADSEPTIPVTSGEAAMHWRATYEPMRAELSRAYPWIEFETFDLAPVWKKHAAKLATSAQEHPLLLTKFPDPFTRALLSKNAMESAVLASMLPSAVSFDGLHKHLMSMHVASGAAKPVLGPSALVAVIPDVRDMSWEQVDAARRLPGLPRLRSVLADIDEQTRLSAAGRGAPVDDLAFVRAFDREYRKAVEETQAGLGSAARSVGIGTALSLASVPLDPATGLIGGAVTSAILEVGRVLVAQRRRRNSWLSAADELTAMAERGRH